DFMLRAALDGKIYGHFVAYVTWEPRKQWDHANNRWQGGPVLKLVSPEFFGSDPEIDTIDEGQYIVTRRRIPTAKAKLIWPGYDEAIDKSAGSEDNHRDWFMPSSLRLSSLNFEDSTAPKATDSYSLVSQRRMVDLITGARGKQRSSTLDAPGRWITVEQFLFKDWTLEKRKRTELVPREELLESGVIRQGDESDMGLDFMTKDGSLLAADNHPKRTIETEVPNFPTYRHVVRLGETILNNDIKKQVWPYRHQPFIVGVNQLLPHVWFGLNSVEMPRTMQDMTNTAMSHILDYVKSMSDPTWKVEEGALSRGDTIKAGAGNVIYFKKNMMNRAQREDPPNMSAGTKAAFEMSVRETQNQTGVHEVAQGRQAKGRATATEMTMLQTNTRLRMALSNALLDAATIRIFETVGEIAQRRLPVGEMIRIVGEKHASTVSQISEEMQFTRYDLEMTVTTAMPYDKEKRRMDAKDLFTMVGMPALKELTDAYDDIIDDPEDFLGRVDAFNELILLKERAEAEATAALQQQQQQPQQATTEPQPQQ
ncbi:MAG: hypothetical protein GWP08_21845, partial [Nitrospiraceae bacterium]|nr:hypothetical protein [Nitrospiraceae bacterium]